MNDSSTPGILEYRQRSGLSRAHLSRLSEVSVTTLFRLEQGITKNPSFHTLQRLAEVLHEHLEAPAATILKDLEERHLAFRAPEESLRNYRRRASITQEELAEAVGVTVGAISVFERGLIDTMFLSTALKISIYLSERLGAPARDILYDIAVAAEDE